MIALILAAALSGDPSPASSIWKPVAYYETLAAADLVSTEHALGPGRREGNPLGQTFGARVLLKVAAGAVLVTVDHKLDKDHHQAWKWTLRLGAGVGTALVVRHNLQAVRR